MEWWRQLVQIALLGGAAFALTACGFADSRAPLPSFMRIKEPDPPPTEPPPNIKQLVHDKLDSIFVSTSSPHDAQVSRPLHEPQGPGWTACVRADVSSAMGKPIGTETYRITIVAGAIVDRRRIDDNDNCASENYEPM